ncbi:anti-sigma factor family protein [Mongoliimonas terrestris]|uniref:anti-sigma factor family protein n=1 Tax=Mongoliimonas terrestris TaxID=1709001 RepID=UPI000A4ED0A5|nr:zf-HC2 domain-containing protein [Mongoliimonas terrestris]
MPKCRDIPEVASAYIDGEMPISGRLAVAGHLTICRECRTYVQGLRTTRHLVATSFRAEVPATVAAALGLTDEDPQPLGKDRRR